ncbi:MAG: hypothetical protein ACTHM6_12970 [Tepidisphaeraceae bacterium]
MTDIAEPIATPVPQGPIIARAGRYYRNARYLMVLALFIFAGWFAYDGYVAWPEKNARIDQTQHAFDNAKTDAEKVDLDRELRQLGAKKTETDIGLQKKLAFGLPIAAVAYLVFMLRKSRGEIRWEAQTLFVPGHPPVPVSAITAMDSKMWEKKGIAVIEYEVDGKRGSLTLDDFVYQQKPIDAIYDDIRRSRAGLGEASAV